MMLNLRVPVYVKIAIAAVPIDGYQRGVTCRATLVTKLQPMSLHAWNIRSDRLSLNGKRWVPSVAIGCFNVHSTGAISLAFGSNGDYAVRQGCVRLPGNLPFSLMLWAYVTTVLAVGCAALSSALPLPGSPLNGHPEQGPSSSKQFPPNGVGSPGAVKPISIPPQHAGGSHFVGSNDFLNLHFGTTAAQSALTRHVLKLWCLSTPRMSCYDQVARALAMSSISQTRRNLLLRTFEAILYACCMVCVRNAINVTTSFISRLQLGHLPPEPRCLSTYSAVASCGLEPVELGIGQLSSLTPRESVIVDQWPVNMMIPKRHSYTARGIRTPENPSKCRSQISTKISASQTPKNLGILTRPPAGGRKISAI
ncbi:hypothetical protein K474DRAFT_1679436 [Panus rudis PR-1116 ss-1]|nr:hypothetical protein K474DRAFT_1679436 [Panus rudis PR-1116 ss-1]